jgi:uncharacterized protein YdeI (YjbR/CyaY-like superfamily)
MRTSKGVDVPIDLADAFSQKPEAWEAFEAMRPQSQKDFVVAVEESPGPVARQQRIERTIRQALMFHERRPRTGVRLP